MSFSNGYILIARKLFDPELSKLMNKPPLYLKLWMWMVSKANFKDRGKLQRGQFMASIAQMQKAMTYKIGYRNVVPTKDQIRGAYETFMKTNMITTAKTTRGLIVTILNYDKYQLPGNYETHNEDTTEDSTYPTLYRKKENTSNISADFFSLRERYLDQNLIDRVFQVIASTRKLNRVADSVLLAQLQKWEKYPVEQVEAGIKIYLQGSYAEQGKREEYLLGIIRNHKVNPSATSEQKTPAWF